MKSKDIEKALIGMWYGDPEEIYDVLDGTDAQTFEQIGIKSHGVVVTTQTGEQFQISIEQVK